MRISLLVLVLITLGCTKTVVKTEYRERIDTVHIETAGELHYASIGADSIIVERITSDTIKEFIRLYRPSILQKDTVYSTLYSSKTDTIFEKTVPEPIKNSILDGFKQRIFEIFCVGTVFLIAFFIYKLR